MSATATAGLRIGEVAKRVGTTPRTIRYYEEIGILPSEGDRESGRHRLYGERDVARLRDALRLKELLGVSLDELKELLEAEETRAALREEWHHGDPGTARRREMLSESLRPARPPARARAPPPRRDRHAGARARGQAQPRDAAAARAGRRVGTPPPRAACRHRCTPAGRAPDFPAMAATQGSATTPEHERLEEARTGKAPWKAWGPYLSERQWGTVREDYSQGGDAWDYFSHDQARSRAYRWGEDGIAGICDERQRLCLSLALWNGADPILKERMFGLTNARAITARTSRSTGSTSTAPRRTPT